MCECNVGGRGVHVCAGRVLGIFDSSFMKMWRRYAVEVWQIVWLAVFLFCKEKSAWNSEGFHDPHNAHKTAKNRQNAVAYIHLSKDLKFLERIRDLECCLSDEHVTSVARHGEQDDVRTNSHL